MTTVPLYMQGKGYRLNDACFMEEEMFKSMMVALVAVLFTAPAFAQWQPPRDFSLTDPQRQIANVVIDDAQRALIKGYYSTQPALAAYLPAAQRQISPLLIQRGNHVPHGATKADLPPELEAQLPTLPNGIERIVIDNNVLLVDNRTNMILDGVVGVVTVR